MAQKLLAGEEEMQTSLQKVLAMEEALQRASEEDTSLRADSRYPSLPGSLEHRLARLLPVANCPVLCRSSAPLGEP